MRQICMKKLWKFWAKEASTAIRRKRKAAKVFEIDSQQKKEQRLKKKMVKANGAGEQVNETINGTMEKVFSRDW